MKHLLTDPFLIIANAIIGENRSAKEWVHTESDDMFQEDNYVSGFDGTEMKFCFSVFLEGGEYWFQLSLEEIGKVSNGEVKEVFCRPANF